MPVSWASVPTTTNGLETKEIVLYSGGQGSEVPCRRAVSSGDSAPATPAPMPPAISSVPFSPLPRTLVIVGAPWVIQDGPISTSSDLIPSG